MERSNILAQLFNLTRDIAGFELHYFSDAVEIKVTPHTPSISIWGVTVNKDGKVFLLHTGNSEQGEWVELEISDRGFDVVALSVLQRLKIIAKQKAA